MIQSMTGYGKAEAQLKGGKLTVEIRTLNSKSADINIKTPLLPKDKDIPVRKKLADRLQRGTIDFFLTYEAGAVDAARPINADALKSYYEQVRAIRGQLPGFTAPGDEANSEILAALLRLPDVVDAKKADAIGEEDWPAVEAAIDEALDHLQAFRSQEGEALYKDVTGRVQTILSLYDEVEKLEGERIETVKARLLKNLEELAQKPDPARFEQELIFYLEKTFMVTKRAFEEGVFINAVIPPACAPQDTLDPTPARSSASSSRKWAAKSTPPVPRRTTPASRSSSSR